MTDWAIERDSVLYVRSLERERDELRAEVEQAKRELYKMAVTYGGAETLPAMIERASNEFAQRTLALNETRAEVERLREDLAQADEDVETVMGVSERLRAVARTVDSFDNPAVSATPDQREVIDAVRYALARPKSDKLDGPGRYGATNRELRAEIERLREKYEAPRDRLRASISISSHLFTPGWRGQADRCNHEGCSWYAENHVADRTTPTYD